MQYYHNPTSATYMDNMNVKKSDLSWIQFYDTYAAMMYKIITDMTADKIVANKILEDLFMDLYKGGISLSDKKHMSCRYILQYTYQFTVKYLTKDGLLVINEPFKMRFPVMTMFYFHAMSLKQAALSLNLNTEDVLEKLRREFLMMRTMVSY